MFGEFIIPTPHSVHTSSRCIKQSDLINTIIILRKQPSFSRYITHAISIRNQLKK